MVLFPTADVETTLTAPASPRLILLGMHIIHRHIIQTLLFEHTDVAIT